MTAKRFAGALCATLFVASGAGVARADDPPPPSSPSSPAQPAPPAAPPPVEPDPPLEPVVVTIEGDRAAPGGVSHGRREAREVPGVLGDPYRSVEIEPGVTPVTSGVPFYFIRGAPPGNIGYFYDGIPLPMLFHVGAGPGIVPPSMISRVELEFGPYPAAYGRLAGAIIDAEPTPARDTFHAEGELRVVDVGGLVEGPLPNGRGSLLAGGHYAIGAEILSAAVPSIDISYADYQARADVKIDDKSRLRFLAFGAYDYLATVDGEARDALVDSDFHRFSLRYDRVLDGGGTARVDTTFGLDRSRGIGVERATDLKLASRLSVVRPLSSRVRLTAGLDLALDAYDVVPGGTHDCTTFICSSGALGDDTESELSDAFATLFPSRVDLALGAFFEMLFVLGDRATITPGLRVDYYRSMGASDVAIDPKIVGRFGIGDHFRLVPGFAVASQLPGFPPVPGLQIGGIPGGLQRAMQSSFGAEGELGPVQLSGSVFRQSTLNLTDSIGAERGSGFGTERFLNRSTGDAYGLELDAKGALTKHVFFLATYTLSRATREIDGARIPSAFDRTHVAQVAFLYELGRGWKAGVRSLFYTGFPAFEAKPGSPLPEDADRVKPFFRLDARLAKRWVLGERAYVGLVFDMQNVTLAKEVFDVTCEDGKCEPREIGPITIPTMVFEAGY